MLHIHQMDSVCATLAFIDGVGAPEMMLIFVIVLVLFGGKKLPEFARGLGKSIREFKKAAAGVEEEFKRALEEDERKNVTPLLAAPTTIPTTSDSPGPDASSYHPDEHYSDDYHAHHPEPDSTAAAGDVVPAATDTVPPATPAAAPTTDIAAPATSDFSVVTNLSAGELLSKPVAPEQPAPPTAPPAVAPNPSTPASGHAEYP